MPTCELVTGDRLPRSHTIALHRNSGFVHKVIGDDGCGFHDSTLVPVLREASRIRQTYAGGGSSCLTNRTSDRGDGGFRAEKPSDCQSLFTINYIGHVAQSLVLRVRGRNTECRGLSRCRSAIAGKRAGAWNCIRAVGILELKQVDGHRVNVGTIAGNLEAARPYPGLAAIGARLGRCLTKSSTYRRPESGRIRTVAARENRKQKGRGIALRPAPFFCRVS